MIVVPVKDLRQDGERRIINHDRVLRVSFFLIVSARIERTHKTRALDAVLLLDPCRDGFIDQIRRVAVIGRLLDLELIQELIIFFVAFLPAVVHALPFLKPAVGDCAQLEAEVCHVDLWKILELQRQQLRVPC